MAGGKSKGESSSKGRKKGKTTDRRGKGVGGGGGGAGNEEAEELNLPRRVFALNRYPPDGRINSYSRPEYMLDILHSLEGTPEFAKLMASPFGCLFQLPIRGSSLSGKLLHNILCRGLVTEKEHELWFVFAGYPFRFSLREFGIVTGLPCGPFPSVEEIKEMQTPPEGQNRYWDTLIGSKHATSVQEIVNWLKRDKRKPVDKRMPGWRRLRLALVVLVEGIICCGSQPVRASIEVVEMVRNLDAFMAYPWGRESFELTIRMIKVGSKVHNLENLVDKLLQSHTLCHGFPLAIQLAIFKSIPLLSEIVPLGGEESFAESENVVLPKLKSFHNNNILQTEYNSLVEVEMILKPNSPIDEEANLWPSDVEDPAVDNVLRIIEEGHQFKVEEWVGGYSGCAIMTPTTVKGKRGKKQRVGVEGSDEDEDDILYQVEVINYSHTMEVQKWFESQRTNLKEELKREILAELLQGAIVTDGHVILDGEMLVNNSVEDKGMAEGNEQSPISANEEWEVGGGGGLANENANNVHGEYETEIGDKSEPSIDNIGNCGGTPALVDKKFEVADEVVDVPLTRNGAVPEGTYTPIMDKNEDSYGMNVVHQSGRDIVDPSPVEHIDATQKVSAVLLSLNELGILDEKPQEASSDEDHEGSHDNNVEVGEENTGDENSYSEENECGNDGEEVEEESQQTKGTDVVDGQDSIELAPQCNSSFERGKKRRNDELARCTSRPKRARVIPTRFRSALAQKFETATDSVVYDPLGSVDGQKKKKFLQILATSRNKEFIIDGHPVKKTFFKGIHTPTNWVDTPQMEAMLSLVWRKLGDSFLERRIGVLDTWFTQTLSNEFRAFKKQRVGQFRWNSLLRNCVRGVIPCRAAKMMWYRDVDYVYAPMNWGKGHWVALAIDLKVGKITILDPLIVANDMKKMKSSMNPILEMLPELIADILALESVDVTLPKTFTAERLDNVYQNERTGDCGPVAVKFIEMDAQGLELDIIDDGMVDELRMKFAVEIYEEFVQPILI